MYSEPGHFDLKLYYKDEFYNNQALSRYADRIFSLGQSVYPVPAGQVLQTTLAMMKAYFAQRIVFPYAEEVSDSQITRFKTQLEPVNHQEDTSSKTALAIATSGTGNEPAISLVSFSNIHAHCQSFFKRVAMDSSSVWLNCMPLQHIAGAMIFYRCGLSRSSMLLHDGFNASKIWQDIHQYPVSHISLVPAMLSRLLDIQDSSESPDLPEHLHYVIVGGDRLASSLYQKAVERGWPLLISYGMTETTSTIALGSTAEQLIPLEGFDVRTDHENILELKGDMIISRYLTERNTVFNDGWFKTSDQVELNQGRLRVIGRNDNMIISGGENLAPEFIEELLIKAPMLKDIAIGRTSNEAWGHTIVALVVGDTERFRIWLEKHVKSKYRPRLLIAVAEIPRTRLGKINRRHVAAIISREYPC